MNMKKLIAALLLAVMLLSAVSAFAASIKNGQPVIFVGSAYGYKSHNARHKTKTIVSKGSWTVAGGNQNGNWIPVLLDPAPGKVLWFNKKYVKALDVEAYALLVAATGVDHLIRYGSGGYGRSEALYATLEQYRTKVAYVKSDGKCNIRKEPCLNSKTFGSFKKGKTLDYMGWRCADSRGVWWYAVEYKKSNNKDKSAWVSSLYTHLSNNG